METRYHLSSTVWTYSDISSIDYFLEDYKNELSKKNIAKAKKLLQKCIDDYSFEPVYLKFGTVKLIIANVDQAVTCYQQLDVAITKYLTNTF